MEISEKIVLVQGDITRMNVDVIVNAANTSLLGGGGVDGAIHRAGGPAILEDCRKIIARQGGCNIGEAVITTAGELAALYVIHTVGPVWNGGNISEAAKLNSCYINSLQLAADNNCSSIAFPAISTGIYKFPKELAAGIAVHAVIQFLSKSDKIEKVYFVCFDMENYTLLQRRLLDSINLL
jgi:O-acetyl-ADP-ribose deacetylase (regulator of RNase III)